VLNAIQITDLPAVERERGLLLHLSIPNLSYVMGFNHSIIFADCMGHKKALKNLKHEESQD
jgi:hypothetical protein